MMSLPVPLSPEIRTGISAPATRSSLWRTSCMKGVCPKMTDSGGKAGAAVTLSLLALASKVTGTLFLKVWKLVPRNCISCANSGQNWLK
jgi:hypothetical protein